MGNGSETVVTHIWRINGKNMARVALVDYDEYDVKLKDVEYVDGTLEESDKFKELLKSGKIKKYRNELESTDVAWLSFDHDRGILYALQHKTLGFDDICGCMSVDNYRNWMIAYGGNYGGSTEFNMKRIGKTAEESFWRIVSELAEEHKKPWYSQEVAENILLRTGVFICAVKSKKGECDHLECTIHLNGCHIDMLKFTDACNEILLKINGGLLDELYVDDVKKGVLIQGSCEIQEVFIGDSVEEVCFSDDPIYYNNPVSEWYPEQPKLLPTSKECKLKKIIGYNRKSADLSKFGALRHFGHCWTYCSCTNKDSSVDKINVKISGLISTKFDNCFHNVMIEELMPYTKTGGKLVLSGIDYINNSFVNFSGLISITGFVTVIMDSFKTNNFAGKFEVSANVLEHSFAYLNKPEEGSEQASGILRFMLTKGNPCVGENDNGGVEVNLDFAFTYDGGHLYRKKLLDWHPWKQTCVVEYSGEKAIDRLYLALHDNICAEIVSPVIDVKVENDVSRDSKSVKFVKGAGRLVEGSAIYGGVREYGDSCFSGERHYGKSCFSSVVFRYMKICVLDDDLQVIGNFCFRNADNVDYLVIPRSCISIGKGAFSGFKGEQKPTKICVYRGSFAYNWSKSKKVKTIVIDSLNDIL